MTAIQKEADEIISMMRRSKMDRIRDYIIKIMRSRDMVGMNPNSRFIEELKKMFSDTSNNAPLP